MFTSRHASTAALAFAAATLLTACGSDSTSPRSTSRPVSLSVATTGGNVVGTGGGVAVGGIAVGTGNQLVITRAQLVLREIELEGPALNATCSGWDDDSSSASYSVARYSQGSDDDGFDDGSSSSDDCGEVELGPVLVDLPLSEGAVQTIAVQIPEGTYHEIDFKLREPDDDTQADLAFRAAHPEFASTSVRVEGTYNGQAFVWTSNLRAEKELEFHPYFTVGAGGTNVTLEVNVASWFTDGSGQAVDPATAGPGTAARAGIEQRIIASFGAFEDHDRDGHDDADDSDDDN